MKKEVVNGAVPTRRELYAEIDRLKKELENSLKLPCIRDEEVVLKFGDIIAPTKIHLYFVISRENIELFGSLESAKTRLRELQGVVNENIHT